ncbi:MAG: hypothetical protein A2W19_05720 [Spirochaetes bacterium RBG_16_49_21]|nr:MAG: hypothetical protein A2W19_05720 [Spirochaetes bacterium RBG_16_49_21]
MGCNYMETKPYFDNKKYRQLIDTAKGLFFKHGVRRITIEEICEKAGVSKVTFYKFFRNKDEIARKVLQEIVDQGMREYYEIVNRAVPFIEKIREIINIKIRKSEEYSDILFEEVLGGDQDLTLFVTSLRNESYGVFAEFLKRGQEEGAIRKSLKPEMMIYFMDVLVDMLNSDRMKNIAPNPRERLEAILNMFFYGIVDSGLYEGERGNAPAAHGSHTLAG